MSVDFEQQTELILAAEDCDSEEFPRLHRFSAYDERLIGKLKAHGPVLLRGGRGSGKSALMIAASRRVAPHGPDASAFGVYLSLRHLPLLNTKDAAYEKVLCQIIIDGVQTNLGGGDFTARPDVASLQRELSLLSSRLGKRIILFFDDAAHIAREASLGDFFDIFRTISSSTVSCKATIYPGVTRFGPRFDVFNDATVLDVSRSEELPGFSELFASIMDARYPDILSDVKFSSSLSKGQVAGFLGQAVLGNMRGFVRACSELSTRVQGGSVGLPELGDILLHLAVNHFWPLLEELKPKLGVYQPMVAPATSIAQVLLEKCGNAEGRRSALVHKDIIERLAKPFEMLEYVGFIAKREASRALKSGGRGTRFSMNFCNLLESTPGARLTRELYEKWSQGPPEPVEFHLLGIDFHGIDLPELDTNVSITILDEPVSKLAKSNAYPYGLTEHMIDVLQNAHITTVGKLAAASDNKLDSLPYIGPAKIRRFRNVVGQAIWM